MKIFARKFLFVGLIAFTSSWSESPQEEVLDSPNAVPGPLSEWQFVIDYAPQIWLAKGEQYFPSSVDFILENTRPRTIKGSVWAVTKEKLPSPSSILPFFHGTVPTDAAWPPPVYAFVLPGPKQPGLPSIQDPQSSTIRVVYFTVYPYNRGKEIAKTVWGNHVSDLEKCYIEFENAKPVSMTCAVHDWDNTEKWADVTKAGNHPIVYSAWGSHGLYFSSGDHNYKTFLKDITSAGYVWETWKNVQIVFPNQWTGMRSSAPDWKDLSYITDLYRWGNPKQGACGFGECQLNDGPSGFLGKGEVREIIRDLDYNVAEAGWTTCAGDKMIPGECPWPAGMWSARKTTCLPGYDYVLALDECFISTYTGKGNDCGSILPHCSSTTGSCGAAWRAHSHGNCAISCYSDCIVSKVGSDTSVTNHNVCGLNGQWTAFSIFRETLPEDDFNFNNGFGNGRKNPFNCTIPVCAEGHEYSSLTGVCNLKP